MSTRKQNMRWLSYFIPLMVIVLILFSTSTHLINNQNSGFLPVSSTDSPSRNTHESLHSILDQFCLIVFPMNHTFGNAKLARPVNNHLQNWQRLVYSKLDLYIFTFIYAALLFIHCFLSLTRKTSKRISVIALPIGGHAPPN